MPRPRQPRPTTIERKIHFYLANSGADQTGRSLPFDARTVLPHLDNLPFAEDGRYLPVADGVVTCCWVDPARQHPRMRLASIRRSALPLVEQGGALQPLTIPTTSGLAEQIHIVFFPRNIVGAELNFYGPRISRLETYLANRGPSTLGPVTFEPLLRQDVAEQLERLRDIRLFRLKIRSTYAATVARADASLGRAFQAAAEAGGAYDLEVILSPKPYSRGRLNERLLGTVRRLLRRPDLREESSRFLVKGLNRLLTNSASRGARG